MSIEEIIATYNFDKKISQIYQKYGFIDIIDIVLNIFENSSTENKLNV